MKYVSIFLAIVLFTTGVVSYFSIANMQNTTHGRCPMSAMSGVDCPATQMNNAFILFDHHMGGIKKLSSGIQNSQIFFSSFFVFFAIFFIFLARHTIRSISLTMPRQWLSELQEIYYQALRKIFFWISLHNKRDIAASFTGAGRSFLA